MENWSIQQAIDAYNSFDGDLINYNTTKYEMRHYLFYGVMMNCIDFRTHKCDFDNGMVQVMEFLSSLGNMENLNRKIADGTIQEGEIGHTSNDTALVDGLITINGVNASSVINMLYSFDNESVTFVGYPTNNSRGSYAEIPISFGIMSVAENKEAVWEALSQMFFLIISCLSSAETRWVCLLQIKQ